MTPLRLHPDRALPVEPGVREAARRIYSETRSLPLVCMHGHVEVEVFAEDRPMGDPAQVLIVPDHYVTRMLLSQGISPPELGLAAADGGPVEQDSRAIWRRFCANWHLFRATPSRYWLEHELALVLGVDVAPGPDTADELYDRIVGTLGQPAFSPRALLDRFDIELISTTDSAVSDLAAHARLGEDGYGDRVVPTFRPDALVHVTQRGWPQQLRRLAEMTGEDTGNYAGYLNAIRLRRQAFAAAGARATDHGHISTDTTPMSDDEAERVYRLALSGQIDSATATAFAGHMLHMMARMSCEDGLVMQIHPGVLRNHDTDVYDAFGPDMGFDIPVAAEFTRSLRPMLEAVGRHPGFRLVLFTVDETTYSRELAPLAGVYPSVRLGAPWWFLDSPDGMRRFRELVTDTAGFYNTSGFVDDTRAFLSIPARHDLARRIDAGYLARLVAEHRLDEDEATETAVDLAYWIPRAAYTPGSSHRAGASPGTLVSA